MINPGFKNDTVSDKTFLANQLLARTWRERVTNVFSARLYDLLWSLGKSPEDHKASVTSWRAGRPPLLSDSSHIASQTSPRDAVQRAFRAGVEEEHTGKPPCAGCLSLRANYIVCFVF